MRLVWRKRNKKEYFDITKTNYLYIYAYMGSLNPQVYQCLRIAYPLSLKYSHNNTFHIIEYGEIQGQYNIQALRIDKNIHDGIYYIDYDKRKGIGGYSYTLYQDKDLKQPLAYNLSTSSKINLPNIYTMLYGDIGIDLGDNALSFFRQLDDLVEEHKGELEALRDDNGRIIIAVEVESGTGLMVLEVVRKWEYSPNNEDFKYWATISEFSLKLDDEIVKDSEGKDIKGYIIEPAGYNPKKSRTAEEQQKIAGGDIRIPAGEYEVFWKKSNIDSPALMAENPNNKERYLDDLQKTMKNLNINIEQLYCNIATCKHNKDNRKTFGTKHIHIVPQLKPKNSKNSVIGTSRNGILIHYGDTGEWSTGCLLPTNELKWKKERWIAKDRNSTVNAVAKLYITLIEHDTESFKNYALGTNNPSKSTIKNFIIKIQEKDKIESYPPEKE